jgi:hypothetical protein
MVIDELHVIVCVALTAEMLHERATEGVYGAKVANGRNVSGPKSESCAGPPKEPITFAVVDGTGNGNSAGSVHEAEVKSWVRNQSAFASKCSG